MIRLIVVTLAALYGVLYVLGDEARRPEEVTRAKPAAPSFLRPVSLTAVEAETILLESEISESEAVRIAMATGAKLRAERKSETQARKFAATTGMAAKANADPVSYWYVTGSKVNLRRGPGTGNAVVGSVTFGEEAEVLSDRNGWFEIRLADGSGSGWIFGKFLSERRPG